MEKKELKVFSNDQYKSDYEFAIKFNNFLLQPIGLWPLTSKNSRLERFFSKISVIYSTFVLLFMTVPAWIELILLKDFQTILQKLGPLSFHMTCAVNYCLFMMHQDKIHFCLERVFDDWRDVKSEEDRAIMKKNVETARYLIVMCAAFRYGGAFSFATVFTILQNYALSSENITVRNLPYHGRFIIFNEEASPFYEVVFSIQSLSTFITCSVICGVCSMIFFFVMHICGQLEIVMRLLNNFVDGNSNDEFKIVNRKIGEITEQHIKSLR